MEKQSYLLAIKNLNHPDFDFNEVLLEKTIITANIHNAVSRIKLINWLADIGITFFSLGTVIEIKEYIDDTTNKKHLQAVVGHKGSACGNIKTERQLEIHWQEM